MNIRKNFVFDLAPRKYAKILKHFVLTNWTVPQTSLLEKFAEQLNNLFIDLVRKRIRLFLRA